MHRLSILIFAASLNIACAYAGDSAKMVRKGEQTPFMTCHEGTYYLATGGTDRIALIKSTSLEGLAEGSAVEENRNYIYNTDCDMTVGALFGNENCISHVLSPVLQHFSEEDFPGNSGWYVYFTLCKKETAAKRIVVMKSLSGRPEGPYGYPANGIPIQSQPVLDAEGNPLVSPAANPGIVKIPSGQHKGVYLSWTRTGQPRIARLTSPWQVLPSSPLKAAAQASSGCSAVYGDNGEIALACSGNGQTRKLTLIRKNGDYADPLQNSSWAVDETSPIYGVIGRISSFRNPDGELLACYVRQGGTWVSGIETLPRIEPSSGQPGPSTLLRTNTPDPCLVYDNGCFYLTMTMTPPDAAFLAIVKDKDLNHLTEDAHPTHDNIIYDPNRDPMVQEVFGKGAKIAALWSPEIHYFSEEEFPGNSGWYIYFALRQVLRTPDGKVTGTVMKTACLKSAGGTLDGPWVHPVTGAPGSAQPLLDKEGKVIKRSLGPSVLRVPSGEYRGIYLMWVLMRGQTEYPDSVFQQRILISHFSSPWHMEGEPGTVTTPTQEWEMRGAGKKRPRVVEGPTAFYGDNGGVFLTYSASPFFSDYGLGQLTLKREGANYANPMLEESWIKYDRNPVFCSVGHPEIAGAGHGFFVRDAAGGRFFCYHAYPVLEDGTRSTVRNAYLEPYWIDETDISASAPEGVIKMGIGGKGQPGPVNSEINFVTKQ